MPATVLGKHFHSSISPSRGKYTAKLPHFSSSPTLPSTLNPGQIGFPQYVRGVYLTAVFRCGGAITKQVVRKKNVHQRPGPPTSSQGSRPEASSGHLSHPPRRTCCGLDLFSVPRSAEKGNGKACHHFATSLPFIIRCLFSFFPHTSRVRNEKKVAGYELRNPLFVLPHRAPLPPLSDQGAWVCWV